MFKFSKGTKSNQKNNIVEANQAINDMAKDQDESGTIETRLSIPETWNMEEESHYVYAFHNSQSPKLKKNQISIYGMELNQDQPNTIMVTGLVRSTITKTIRFGDTSVMLQDKNGKTIAKKTFDLKKLGILPPNTSRPCEFNFNPDDFIQEDVESVEDGWKLAFEIKQTHKLDLDPSWEEGLNEQTKSILKKIVDESPELGEKEVNLTGIKIEFNQEDNLVTTILIRNGNKQKNMTIEKLPLKIIDATDKEVARGTFTMNDFTVNANTSKPWSFIFPKETVQESPDLSKWKVVAITDKQS